MILSSKLLLFPYVTPAIVKTTAGVVLGQDIIADNSQYCGFAIFSDPIALTFFPTS